jgi:hypothetical protein
MQNHDYDTIECREDDCEERVPVSDGAYCCEHDPAQVRIRELTREVAHWKEKAGEQLP